MQATSLTYNRTVFAQTSKIYRQIEIRSKRL